MNENIRPLMVTIQCIAFNHEPYIRQCLEGFVMQKTNFRFEAIVHDDASTDGTATIIREYAVKYPDIIKPIFETENQYSKYGSFTPLQKIMNEHTHGKYVAFCEGDDYWTDPQKLQKQVFFLETNPICTMAVSNGIGYIESLDKYVVLNSIPTIESKFLTMSEVLIEKNGLIPTASMCCRREYVIDKPTFFDEAPVGDRPLRMWCAVNGKIYYDVTPMVVYRKGSIGSFTQSVNTNKKYAQHIYDDMCVFYDNFDQYTKCEYHAEVQYMKNREEYYFYHRIGDYNALKKCTYYQNLSPWKRIKLSISFYLKDYPSLLCYLYKVVGKSKSMK